MSSSARKIAHLTMRHEAACAVYVASSRSHGRSSNVSLCICCASPCAASYRRGHGQPRLREGELIPLRSTWALRRPPCSACICAAVYIAASAHAHASQFAIVRSISEVHFLGRRWGGGQEDWSATRAVGGSFTLAVRSGVRGSHSCMHSRCPIMCVSVLKLFHLDAEN